MSQISGDLIRQKRQSEDNEAIQFPDSGEDGDSDDGTDNRYFFNRRRPYQRPNQLQYRPQRPQQYYNQGRPQRPNDFQISPSIQYEVQQVPGQYIQRPQNQNQFQRPNVYQQFPQNQQFQQFQRPPSNQFQSQQNAVQQRPTPAPQPLPPATTLSPEVSRCNMRCGESVTHEFDPVCGSDLQTYNNRGYLECARRCGVNAEFLRQGRCRPRIRPV